jgi:hypothetical protein
MRLSLSSILSIILAVVLVAFGFAFYQSSIEKKKLIGELKTRTSMVSDAIVHNNRFLHKRQKQPKVERFADSIRKEYNLLGLALYLDKDTILSNNSAQGLIRNSKNFIVKSLMSDTASGNFFKFNGNKVYQYVIPIKFSDSKQKAVIFYADAAYIK